MITPRFSCSQTEDSVIVSVYCPSIRASQVEIHVDDTLLSLHINPYFLRLNFTNRLLEDDGSSAHYDAGSGYLTITLTKEVKGQEFKDLDLLTKLLAPRRSDSGYAEPSIEVISTNEGTSSIEDDLVERAEELSISPERREILEASRNDWQLPQNIPDPLPTLHTSLQKQYGFLNMYSGYFVHVSHTENEANELGADVETCPDIERRKRRLQHEEVKWDEEHYMADFADDEYIQEIIAWKHPFADDGTEVEYTEEEKLTMLRLPRKEYLASPAQIRGLYLTLVTLLFSYAYESRTTQCEPTPESAWTISSLTPAFSALDPPPYPSIQQTSRNVMSDFPPFELASTLVPSYRRSLAFPLYRSFALAEACRADITTFLRRGKRTVLRCLMELKKILDHHEVYYVYSKIWVDDFCSWVQAYSTDEDLATLGRHLSALTMKKLSTGWPLEELEAATLLPEDRESDSDDE